MTVIHDTVSGRNCTLEIAPCEAALDLNVFSVYHKNEIVTFLGRLITDIVKRKMDLTYHN